MTLDQALSGLGDLGTLGGSIASLFGSDNNNVNRSDAANAKLVSAQRPYQAPIVTPGYTFAGGALGDRSNYAAQTDALSKLYGNQLGGINLFQTGVINPLRASIAPGYGNLTNAMVAEAQNKGAQTYGNLRDQLAQRNVLGASFAQNQLSGQESQNIQDANLARAQAFQQEMQANLGLNQNQLDALAQQLANVNAQASQTNQQAQQRLAELGVAAGFLKNVNQVGNSALEAYKNNAVSQALGVNSTGFNTGNSSDTGSSGGGGGGGGSTIPASFQGLPMPGNDDHKWTKALQGFIANNDVAGYKAYLQSRGAL